MREFQFDNVTVTVKAETALDAYTALSNALAPFDFTTDTFNEITMGMDEGLDTRDRDTEEIFKDL